VRAFVGVLLGGWRARDMFKQVSLIRCLITIAAQNCGRLAKNNFADEKRKPFYALGMLF
jgi:hypothetical protein